MTRAEELLYGEFAGAVRQIGQAAAHAADGYSLACKELNDISELPDWALDLMSTCLTMSKAHRDIALIVLEQIQEREQLNGPGEYPSQDGDATVLGPEVIASRDERVITWRGEQYVRRD